MLDDPSRPEVPYFGPLTTEEIPLTRYVRGGPDVAGPLSRAAFGHLCGQWSTWTWPSMVLSFLVIAQVLDGSLNVRVIAGVVIGFSVMWAWSLWSAMRSSVDTVYGTDHLTGVGLAPRGMHTSSRFGVTLQTASSIVGVRARHRVVVIELRGGGALMFHPDLFSEADLALLRSWADQAND